MNARSDWRFPQGYSSSLTSSSPAGMRRLYGASRLSARHVGSSFAPRVRRFALNNRHTSLRLTRYDPLAMAQPIVRTQPPR